MSRITLAQVLATFRLVSAYGQSQAVQNNKENWNEKSILKYRAIDGFTNFMYTILTKVVPDNLKACLGFVRHSNNYYMQSGFQVLKYHC